MKHALLQGPLTLAASRLPETSWPRRAALVGLLACVPLLLIGAVTAPGSRRWLVLPIILSVGTIAGGLVWQARRHAQVHLSVFDFFLLVSFVSGCVLPTLNLVGGAPELSYRPVSSDSGAIEAAWVNSLFALVVVLGWVLASHLETRRRTPTAAPSPHTQRPLARIAIVALVLGVVGLALRLPHDPRALLGTGWLVNRSAGGLFGLASTWFTALLPVGTFLIVMSGALDRLARRRLVIAALALASVVALASYSLNRATLFIPVATMMLIWSRRRGARGATARLVAVVALAMVAVVGFILLGQFRTAAMYRQQNITAPVPSPIEYAQSSLQNYFQSPYLPGVLFESGSQAELDATSLLGSALSPIPVLGQHFRADSGLARYNYEIYKGVSEDQILPVATEGWLSLGPGGLVAIALLAGLAICWVDRAIERRRDILQWYVLIFSGLWLSQVTISSVQALSQVFFYFVLPLLGLTLVPSLWSRVQERRGARA